MAFVFFIFNDNLFKLSHFDILFYSVFKLAVVFILLKVLHSVVSSA